MTHVLLLVLAALALSGATGADELVVMAPGAFGEGLVSWERRGEAEFGLDTQRTHEGRASARVRVADGVKLDYQQIHRTYRDVREGDTFRFDVWLQTEGVDGPTGAYAALEYVDGRGDRLSIAHSRTGARPGSAGWERLTAEGVAPRGVAALVMRLVLHSRGTAWFASPALARTGVAERWPDLGDAVRSIRVGEVAHPDFGGIGFHAFHHTFAATPEELNEVTYKRWNELRPSFARLNHQLSWTQADLERVAEHIARMKATGTTVYVATWDPPDVKTPAELAAYARSIADTLEFWVVRRGLRNIQYYCMSNELSLSGWGKLAGDLPRFKQYHQALFDEFQRRKLPVGLLATDAAPVDYWPTIEWAAANMDGITAVYGGHHYINDRTPDDASFYKWWLAKLKGVADVARARGKRFILGEFGSKQDGRTIDGNVMDACFWFGTPQEPMVGVQVSEAAIAAINAGVWAAGYWTFMDLPDEFAPGYRNKWGLFKCSGADRSIRSLYFAYGLMSRYFRGPSSVHGVSGSDPLLRAAAVRARGGGWSVAVVNRNERAVKVRVALPAGQRPSRPFRRYVYDPARPAQQAFGDMPGPTGLCDGAAGAWTDTLPPSSLTVYTTAYDSTPPPPVAGLDVTRAGDGVRVAWKASPAPDTCYYRVYRDGKQVVSTVATGFTDRTPGARYAVVPVDGSGNAGPPTGRRAPRLTGITR